MRDGRQRMPSVCGGLLLGLWLAAGPGWAGYEEGLRAYHRADYATALREWQPLAQQDHVEAQFSLGLMYDKGRGVPQNAKHAVQWYQRAAEQGYPAAQVNLGRMYAVGRGVPQSYAQALQWYRRAAEQGDAVAQHNLGRMYAEGQGVSRDALQAYVWYALAAAHFPSDADRETAIQNRDLTAQRLTAPQLARAQDLARTWRPKPETPSQRPQPAVLQEDAPTRIRRAQERLTALGIAPGPVDGVFGPRMRTALEQFQRRQRLPVTGELDAATERALGAN